jgi:hypothetical protein
LPNNEASAMTVKQSILLLVAVAITVVVVVSAAGLYRKWCTFEVEDQIHGAFFPVAKALAEYEHNHGTPATNLIQLVPGYLSQLPTSRFADSVDYFTLDGGRGWQLNIHSHALQQPRLYCCRSNQKFTQAEERRILFRYHGIWTVLKE